MGFINDLFGDEAIGDIYDQGIDTFDSAIDQGGQISKVGREMIAGGQAFELDRFDPNIQASLAGSALDTAYQTNLNTQNQRRAAQGVSLADPTATAVNADAMLAMSAAKAGAKSSALRSARKDNNAITAQEQAIRNNMTSGGASMMQTGANLSAGIGNSLLNDASSRVGYRVYQDEQAAQRSWADRQQQKAYSNAEKLQDQQKSALEDAYKSGYNF